MNQRIGSAAVYQGRFYIVNDPGIAECFDLVVVDAFNLQRNLYYATQVIELGQPTIVALNMVDVAEQNGHGKIASLLRGVQARVDGPEEQLWLPLEPAAD